MIALGNKLNGSNGVFTLTETETDKGTEPIKWVLNPLASVTVSVLVSVSVSGSVNTFT